MPGETVSDLLVLSPRGNERGESRTCSRRDASLFAMFFLRKASLVGRGARKQHDEELPADEGSQAPTVRHGRGTAGGSPVGDGESSAGGDLGEIDHHGHARWSDYPWYNDFRFSALNGDVHRCALVTTGI